MPSATVMLKEGLSYSYPDGVNVIKFTQVPVTVTGRDLIDKLKSISCLAVEEHQDKPVAPLAKQAPGRSTRPVGKPAPAPEPEPEEEPESELEDEGEPEATAEEEGSEPVESDEEPEAEVEAEPEPAKPAKGGKPGPKGKKG